jgi:thiamine pyrophosphokinase
MTGRDNFCKFIDFAQYKSILCLHGKLPPKKFFDMHTLPIIAADGAADILWSMDVAPNIVIGDLDSISADSLKKTPSLKIEDQNYSDFQKAFGYIEEKSLTPSIICGVGGGYLDHILNNINIFLKTRSILIDEDIIGLVISEQKIFELPINTKLSIFGIPECVVSTQGLRWNLNNHRLTFPGDNSCFNRIVSRQFLIDIKAGNALLLFYTIEVLDAGYI